MKLSTYLKKNSITQEAFAKRIQVSQGLVWQWLNGVTKITPENAKLIERETAGDVTRADCRPDLWDRERAA